MSDWRRRSFVTIVFAVAALALVVLLSRTDSEDASLVPASDHERASTVLAEAQRAERFSEPHNAEPDSTSVQQRNAVEAGASPQRTVVLGRLIQAGKPLDRVRVIVSIRESSSHGDTWSDFATQSNPDGTFSIELPITEPRTAGLRAEGMNLPERRAALGEIEPGTTRDLQVIEFPNCGTIRGSLRDSLGAPIVGVTVIPRTKGMEADDSLGGSWFVPYGSSDENGQYVLSGVIPGTWTIELRAPGISATPREVEVPPGATIVLDFELNRSPRISGRALYASGAAARGVDVAGFVPGTWNRVSTNHITDESGRFVLERPAASPFAAGSSLAWDGEAAVELRAIDRTHRDVPTTVHWGDSDVTLQVEDRGRVELVVLDDATGSPLSDFGCRIGDGQALGQWEEITVRDGHAQVDVVTDSALVFLTIIAPDSHSSRGPIAVTVLDAQTSPVTVRLERAQALDVTIVDERGSPVSDAEVKVVAGRTEFAGEGILKAADARKPVLRPEDPRQTYYFDRRHADGAGHSRVSLPQLDGWSHWLVITAPGYPVRGFPVTREQVTQAVTLTRGVDLTVRLHGTWPPNARLRLVARDPASPASRVESSEAEIVLSDSESRITLPHAGLWDCHFRSAAGGDFVLRSIEFAAPGAATLELDAAVELWPARTVMITKRGEKFATGVLRFAESATVDSPVLERTIQDGRVDIPALPRRAWWVWIEDARTAQSLEAGFGAGGILDFP